MTSSSAPDFWPPKDSAAAEHVQDIDKRRNVEPGPTKQDIDWEIQIRLMRKARALARYVLAIQLLDAHNLTSITEEKLFMILKRKNEIGTQTEENKRKIWYELVSLGVPSQRMHSPLWAKIDFLHLRMLDLEHF
jgi:hypothetical protein